jgi:predicted TIM-barrel fold metal-dependent hydrolase
LPKAQHCPKRSQGADRPKALSLTNWTARNFFEKHQDRILFGTDATPHGDEFPQQVFNDKLYEIYYRFLETDDEYFDYAPAKTPPQGRWQIYGINLPDSILRKVYYENAARELHITI